MDCATLKPLSVEAKCDNVESVKNLSDERKSQMMLAAEAAKEKGNQYFKDGNYIEAVKAYSNAMDECYDDETGIEIDTNMHIYLNNRAFSQLKLENYGSCIMDANKALQYKPSFTKAMYRKGCANIFLGKFSEASRCFREVLSLQNDSESLARLKECEKKIKWERFSKAIASEKLSKTLDINTIQLEANYSGPVYDKNNLNTDFLVSVCEYLKSGKKLAKKYAFMIIKDALEIFEKDNTLVHIPVNYEEEMTVCGDVHGQFYDLLKIFELNKHPSKTNPYLFNGDIVDRGSFSVECLLVLTLSKIIEPKSMYIARGNHETRNMNSLYGFLNECKSKYDMQFYELCCELFCALPIVHVINNRIFVTHGGLPSQDNVKLSDIEKIDRFCEPPNEGVYVDLLWSDPHESLNYSESKRGVGCQFGSNITEKFLNNNGLDLVVRSHEMETNGYRVMHNDKLISIFSAPNYCDSMGNKGAYIRFKNVNSNTGLLSHQFYTFEASPHPNVPAMQYAHESLTGGAMQQQLRLQQMLAQKQ